MTIVARCGFDCERCPMLDANIRNEADRAEAQKGWSKYWDLNIPLAEVRCKGCLVKRPAGYSFPDRTCRIKDCCEMRGLDNCGHCCDYPCDMMRERTKVCEDIIRRHRGTASPSDRATFLEPFDSEKNLKQECKRK